MMKILIKMVFLILIVSMLFITAGNAQSYTGLVSIDSVNVHQGENFGLPIRLSNNDIDIAGLMVPVSYPSSYLTVDSVSFAGSFKTSDFNGSVFLGETDLILITYVLNNYQSPIPAIPVPNGIIATIYFTVSENAPIGIITIDSVNQDEPYWRKVHLSDETGYGTFLPDFIEGAVNVETSLGVDDNLESVLPTEFSLKQNYPNPFNPSTIIEFALPKAGVVKLEVFNILGQSVKILVNGSLSAGIHRTEFDASEQPTGVYFYRLTHLEGTETKKMILVK